MSDVPGELKPQHGLGHAGEVAFRKVREPGWEPFKIETIGKTRDALYTGGVPVTTKSGRQKWPKPHTQVVVTEAEREAEAERYEREHGRCRECFGSGAEWAGWSASDGHRTRPCGRCNATGRPLASALDGAKERERRG